MTVVSSAATANGAGGPASRSPARRIGPWLLLIAGLLLVAILVGAPDESGGERFDPASAEPNGAKAVVELLESFDATVDVDVVLPSDATDVALILTDALDERGADDVEGWIRRGGTLVVADPFSSFSPAVAGATGAFGVAPALERDVCDIGELEDLTVVDPGSAVLYEPDPPHASCFGDGDQSFVVSQPRGEGRVVSLGGGDVFTNEQLGRADNAALAARLLVPERGAAIAVLQPGDGEGSADRSLTDVMSTGVRLALVQLVLAFAVYAWFRARRLGRPILEPQPVEIAGSELVLAVGQLLQQTKNPNRAAELLRSDLRRRVAERLGLPSHMPPDVMADVVVGRTGLDAAQVHTAIADTPITTDAELLELARTVESVRQEILHDH